MAFTRKFIKHNKGEFVICLFDIVAKNYSDIIILSIFVYNNSKANEGWFPLV